MARRVAITGMGIVTAHGLGKPVNWANTLAGLSGIRPITLFNVHAYRTQHAGQLTSLPIPPWRRLHAARADRASNLLYHATAEALADSALTPAMWCGNGTMVALGTTLGGMTSGERYHHAYVTKTPSRARPSRVLDHLAHCQPFHVMEEFGIPGTPIVLSNACASGANAIGFGYRSIRAGAADLVVCGGYDPLCEFAFAGFHALQALTTDLCRPFDRDRSGLVLGEGAGVLILEDGETAQRRGARVVAEIIGYGESNDAFHLTRPDPKGQHAARAIQQALADADLPPENIDYVNAHGTGTPFNDASEAAALQSALGPRASTVPVSSSKSMTGHLLGGAGAVEAILTVMALDSGWLPPNVNYQTPDPACCLEIVQTARRADRLDVALSDSFGFGGANAALVFRTARC